MLPLALASQLSTSGVGKAIPSVLCKLIWSFVMEHNTAKLIKAILFTYRLTPAPDIMGTTFCRIYFNYGNPFCKWYRRAVKLCKRIERRMNDYIENGERHAPQRPSGKSLAHPICIQ